MVIDDANIRESWGVRVYRNSLPSLQLFCESKIIPKKFIKIIIQHNVSVYKIHSLMKIHAQTRK